MSFRIPRLRTWVVLCCFASTISMVLIYNGISETERSTILKNKFFQFHWGRDKQLVEAETCPHNSSRSVILLTYGRSGSSLTSDIINQHEDVFFYYEPLHNLAKSFSEMQDIYKRENKRYLHLTDIPKYNSQAINALHQQMTCNYTALGRLITLNNHARLYNSTKDLRLCVARSRNRQGEVKCLHEAQKKCEQKPLKLIKTIRLLVRSAAKLLAGNPCSKLIYMVRDPRGSYYSKTRMFRSHGANATYEAERFCSRLQNDLVAVLKLKQKYPDRVFMTRFEKLASEPVQISKEIYKFLDLEFTDKVERFVQSKTHSKQSGRGYSNDRTDAKEACYKWRKMIPFKAVTAFDNLCSKSYSMLGYLKAENLQYLRNFNRTLLRDTEYFP